MFDLNNMKYLVFLMALMHSVLDRLVASICHLGSRVVRS